MTRNDNMRSRSIWCAVSLALLAALAGCRDRPAHRAHRAAATEKQERRDAALAGARVWTRQPIPPAALDFSDNTPAPGAFHSAEDVACDFVLQPPGGTTPKFYCRLPDGRVVKVRYGAANPEIPAGIAATRLLGGLGFAVDRLDEVHSVRCRGCPALPFEALRCVEGGAAPAGCLQGLDQSHVVTFDRAAIERPYDGRAIEAFAGEGWAWYELDRIDPAAGGSSRAEVDALRLMAVLLAHWDNKAKNQRLVCPPGDDGPDGACRAPVAVLHDLGAAFGPLKLDLQNWRSVGVWQDRAACRVSLRTLPFAGGTFADHRISEEGRQLALRLLRPLSTHQVETLFAASGVTSFDQILAAARIPSEWARPFAAKVDQIAAGPPCEPAAQLAARGE